MLLKLYYIFVQFKLFIFFYCQVICYNQANEPTGVNWKHQRLGELSKKLCCQLSCLSKTRKSVIKTRENWTTFVAFYVYEHFDVTSVIPVMVFQL